MGKSIGINDDPALVSMIGAYKVLAATRLGRMKPRFVPDISALEPRNLLSVAAHVVHPAPVQPLGPHVSGHVGNGAEGTIGSDSLIQIDRAKLKKSFGPKMHVPKGPKLHAPKGAKLQLPGVTPPSVTKNGPLTPPAPPTTPPAPTSTTALNQKVLDFAQSNLGTQVGDGECATLIAQAYTSAGAVPFYQLGPTGLDADYVWGTLVTTLHSAGDSTAGILPGDVVQFGNASFSHTTKFPDGSSVTNTSSATHHTAVVTSVSGSTVNLLEQNVQSPDTPPAVWKTVQVGSFDLKDIQPGSTLWVYRPIQA